MSEFPGYRTARQVKRDKSRERGLQVVSAENARWKDKNREYQILKGALPILIRHGDSLKVPAEIPKRFGHRLSAAWIVVRFVNSSSSDRAIDYEVVENIFALTPDGLFGFGTGIDRGITAVRFHSKPLPLALDNMLGGNIAALKKPAWQVMDEEITGQLASVGVNFRVEYR